MSSQAPKETPYKTSLLNSQDYDAIEAVLATRSKRSLNTCTAVVQVFEGPHAQWEFRAAGAACLVRDGAKRSYFIVVVDPSTRSIVFEQEMYLEFKISADPDRWFQTFSTDKHPAALNFADDRDAQEFYDRARKVIRKNGMTLRKQQGGGGAQRSAPPAPSGGPRPGSVQRSAPAPRPAPTSTMSRKSTKKGSKKGDKPKFDKSMISNPSNFQHVGHIGFEEGTGFDASNIPDEWQVLLDKVGIKRENLDKDTADFVMKFVNDNGGIDAAVRNSGGGAPPPPPPTQGGGSRRGGPPPPPPVSQGRRGGEHAAGQTAAGQTTAPSCHPF